MLGQDCLIILRIEKEELMEKLTKISENYVCPDSCSDCINRQCCSLDYIMTTDGHFTCNSSLYANCECPIGFEPAHVFITPSLFLVWRKQLVRSGLNLLGCGRSNN